MQLESGRARIPTRWVGFSVLLGSLAEGLLTARVEAFVGEMPAEAQPLSWLWKQHWSCHIC